MKMIDVEHNLGINLTDSQDDKVNGAVQYCKRSKNRSQQTHNYCYGNYNVMKLFSPFDIS